MKRGKVAAKVWPRWKGGVAMIGGRRYGHDGREKVWL